jgi:ribosomal protein S6
MKKYEIAMILDGQLGKDEKDAIVKKVTDAIAKAGGKVINNQVWLAKQKFVFKIKRHTEGTYYLLNIEAEGSAVLKIRQALALNEDVLRFLITIVE